MELLSQQPEGAFFVRESASSLGSYALSMVAPDSGVRHFLIEERDGHFSLSLTVSVFKSHMYCMLDVESRTLCMCIREAPWPRAVGTQGCHLGPPRRSKPH